MTLQDAFLTETLFIRVYFIARSTNISKFKQPRNGKNTFDFMRPFYANTFTGTPMRFAICNCTCCEGNFVWEYYLVNKVRIY